MPILRSVLSCAGLLGALLLHSPAVAGPPVVKKIDTSTIAAGTAVVPKIKAPSAGVDTSLRDIAAAMSIPESALGTRVTLTAATPRVGQTYMRLLGPQSVDPSIPQIEFFADGLYGRVHFTQVAPFTAVELHFLAKAGKSYFIECEVRPDRFVEWILGEAKEMPRILTTTKAARPMFVYTAREDGDTGLHFTMREGAWSVSKCQITPVA